MNGGKLIDLTGKRFGHLIAIERVINTKFQYTRWLCKCDCGAQKEIAGNALIHKKTSSCGCSFRLQAMSKGKTKHGYANKTSEYNIWSNMKARCKNSKKPDYKDYGGRGIQVCERWMSSFELFLTDMGLRPSSDHSLDRIDVNGNYEPSNCKWSTSIEQSRNKRISSKNKSGYSGVNWLKSSNKWEVSITTNRKYIYLGRYEDIETAIRARKEAEYKYWGKQSS